MWHRAHQESKAGAELSGRAKKIARVEKLWKELEGEERRAADGKGGCSGRRK